MSATPPAMRLATDIAAQFRHLPDDQAAASLAEHITRFWAPRMHDQLRQQVSEAGAACDPVIAGAVAVLGSR